MIIRVLRDLCQRVHSWTPLSQWVICIRHLNSWVSISQIHVHRFIFKQSVGFGTIDRKDNLISWHAIEPGRLYAPCNGSPFNWITNQWASLV